MQNENDFYSAHWSKYCKLCNGYYGACLGSKAPNKLPFDLIKLECQIRYHLYKQDIFTRIITNWCFYSGCDFWTSYVSSSIPIDGEADMEFIATIRDQLSSQPLKLCEDNKIVDIRCREKGTLKPSTAFPGEPDNQIYS